MANRQRRRHEVDDAPILGIDRGRSILLSPSVVVLGNRQENGRPARSLRKRDALLHESAGEMRVIGLGDQVNRVGSVTNDHAATLLHPMEGRTAPTIG